MAPSCVVLTPITHASTHISRCQVYGHVKVAALSVPIALTLWGEGKGQLRSQVPRIRHPQGGREGITFCQYHRPEFTGGSLRTSRLQNDKVRIARVDYRGGLRVLRDSKVCTPFRHSLVI